MRGTFAVFWAYVVLIFVGILLYTIVGATHN